MGIIINARTPLCKNRTENRDFACLENIIFNHAIQLFRLIGRKRRVLQAVRCAFECSGGLMLQATGQCRNDTKSASCGPSYKYIDIDCFGHNE